MLKMWKNQIFYRTLIYSTCFICDVNAVLGFGAVWYRRSLSTLRRNMLSPPSGLKWECREVEGLYTIWGAKDEGREPIREKEYGKGTRQYVGAIIQVEGGGEGQHKEWSKRRESPFQGPPDGVIKMHTACFSEMLATTYNTTQHQNSTS
jgi:hypothetical protein